MFTIIKMLSNLSKNQMIAIGAVVIIVLVGIVLLVRRNNDQEEYKEIVEVLDIMKQQENRENINNFKQAKAKLPENISNEKNPRSKTFSYTRSSVLDRLYTEIPIKAVKGQIMINNIPVEHIFYDDVDLWFVGTQMRGRDRIPIITSYIVKYSPNGTSQSFTYSGEAKDFMQIHPSQLRQRDNFIFSMKSSPNSTKTIFDAVVLPLFQMYGSSMLPNFSSEEIDRIIKNSNIDIKKLINALSTNEFNFRKMIRDSRLQLREMEDNGIIINDETKNRMIATEIAKFMTRDDIVSNFRAVVDQLSQINIKSCDVNILNAYNKILATYKEMLMRLAGSMRTNFETYAQYCSQNGKSEEFKELVQHLQDIFTMNKAIQDMARPIPIEGKPMDDMMIPIEGKPMDGIVFIPVERNTMVNKNYKSY